MGAPRIGVEGAPAKHLADQPRGEPFTATPSFLVVRPADGSRTDPRQDVKYPSVLSGLSTAEDSP